MKSFFILVLTFCLVLSFVSCSVSDNKQNDNTCYIKFTDSSGKEIKLTSKPKKVAVLFSSFAEMWKDAGGDIAVTVGDSIERGFASDDTVIVDSGSGHTTINTELLIASNVDFIIGTADYSVQADVCNFMNSIGIPSALFKVDSFDDYLKVFKIFTDICDTPSNYDLLGTSIKQRIDGMINIAESSRKAFEKDMLFIRAGGSARSTKAKKADDHFACAMLEELGMQNIAESVPVLYDGLSLEEIIKCNPEYIFISVMGDEVETRNYIGSLFQKDGWNGLRAVKENKVIFLPKDLFHYKPNSKWADAYEYLINIIICPESDK